MSSFASPHSRVPGNLQWGEILSKEAFHNSCNGFTSSIFKTMILQTNKKTAKLFRFHVLTKNICIINNFNRIPPDNCNQVNKKFLTAKPVSQPIRQTKLSAFQYPYP